MNEPTQAKSSSTRDKIIATVIVCSLIVFGIIFITISNKDSDNLVRENNKLTRQVGEKDAYIADLKRTIKVYASKSSSNKITSNTNIEIVKITAEALHRCQTIQTKDAYAVCSILLKAGEAAERANKELQSP